MKTTTIILAGLFSLFAKEQVVDFDDSQWVTVNYIVGEHRLHTRVPENWPEYIVPIKTSKVIHNPWEYVKQHSNRGSFTLGGFGYDYIKDGRYFKEKFAIAFMGWVPDDRENDLDQILLNYRKRASESMQYTVTEQSYFQHDGREWLYQATTPRGMHRFATWLYDGVIFEMRMFLKDGGDDESDEWKQKRVDLFKRVFEHLEIEKLQPDSDKPKGRDTPIELSATAIG